MRGNIRAVCRVALLSEPVAKTGRGVRLAKMRDQECLHTDRWRGVYHFTQFGMHRDFQMRFLIALRFALVNGKDAIVNVLRSHLNDIAAALTCEQQKAESEPRLGANWVLRFKASDMVFRPRLVPGGLHFLAGDAKR